jgi:hypothetical protein
MGNANRYGISDVAQNSLEILEEHFEDAILHIICEMNVIKSKLPKKFTRETKFDDFQQKVFKELQSIKRDVFSSEKVANTLNTLRANDSEDLEDDYQNFAREIIEMLIKLDLMGCENFTNLTADVEREIRLIAKDYAQPFSPIQIMLKTKRKK